MLHSEAEFRRPTCSYLGSDVFDDRAATVTEHMGRLGSLATAFMSTHRPLLTGQPVQEWRRDGEKQLLTTYQTEILEGNLKKKPALFIRTQRLHLIRLSRPEVSRDRYQDRCGEHSKVKHEVLFELPRPSTPSAAAVP